MKSVERKVATKLFLDSVYDTLDKKGNDYASDKNPFSNFTNTATVCQIPVEKVFTVMMCIKINRIVELIGHPATNESILDSVKDLAGYAALLDNYLRSKENGEEEKRKSCVVEGSGVASVQPLHQEAPRGCTR